MTAGYQAAVRLASRHRRMRSSLSRPAVRRMSNLLTVCQRDSINYLSTLPPTAFEHLFKVMDPHDVDVLRKAYNLTHVNTHCPIDCTYACKLFHSSARPQILWECTQAVSCISMISARRGIHSCLSSMDKHCLHIRKTHIKHLSLVIQSFWIAVDTHTFILDEFIGGNTALQTMAILLETDVQEAMMAGSAPNSDQKKLLISVTELMSAMERNGVAVSLEVYIPSLSVLDVHVNRPISARSYLSLYPVIASPLNSEWLNVFPVGASLLQDITMHVSNFSDDLLRAFARRAQRNSLRTLTITKDDSGDNERIPNLSMEAWGTLLQASPGLRVSCDLQRIQHNILLLIMKPNVPLVSVTINDISVNLQNNLIDTCVNFSRTLNCVICYTKAAIPVGRFKDLVAGRYSMSLCQMFIRESDLTITVF